MNDGRRVVRVICIALFLVICIVSHDVAGQSLKDSKALLNRSRRLYKEGRIEKAIPPAEQALSIRQKMLGSEHPKVGGVHFHLGRLYDTLGEYEKAESHYLFSLTILEKALGPGHQKLTAVLNHLGDLYRKLGDYRKAQPLIQRALKTLTRTMGPDHWGVGRIHLNLGNLYRSLGDFKKAELHLIQSLGILKKTLSVEHPKTVKTLLSLGGLYRALGDYTKAEPLFQQALKTLESTKGPEHWGIGDALKHLGRLYQTFGNYAKAESYYKRSLKNLEEALGLEHPKVAGTLLHLGKYYRALGEYEKAEPLFKRSLEIREKTLEPDHPKVRGGLITLAFLYLQKGRVEEALKIFKAQHSSRGTGRCYLAMGNYKQAEKAFRRVVKGADKKGKKNDIIFGHYSLGLSYEAQKNFDQAKKHFQMAIHTIEDQWRSLSLEARENFLAAEVGPGVTRLDPYEGMIRVLIDEKGKGHEAEALSYAESVKSRTFLEMLAARGAAGKGKEDREILKKDREYQQEIAALREQVRVLEELGPKAPRGRIEQAQKTMDQRVSAYESFIKKVKLVNAETASLISTESISVEKLQALLDTDISILEYYTTKDVTYAWLIDQNRIRAFKFPVPLDTMAFMVNDLLLPNISKRSIRPEPLILLKVHSEHGSEIPEKERLKNRQRFQQTMETLYRKIVEPMEKDIRTDKLIIVPHGVLHKVPFAAMSDGSKFILDRFAVSMVPSASILQYVIEKRNPDRGKFLAFANPETDYLPLVFAETEVKNISKYFDEKQVYYREKATESAAKSNSKLSDVIHFASHGEFNDKQPMQSGLLLAKDKNNDGYLQVHETFGLDLANSNLVVLSACETGISKIFGGDDLVGLSRGFIYAGTPSLMATLWEVDDRSTAVLIERFYENWHKKEMSKPEALRQAQLTLKNISEYRHPFYWAPFIMIGDWR